MIVNSFRTRAAICAAGAAVVAALTAGTAIAVADANDDAFLNAFSRALANSGPPGLAGSGAVRPFSESEANSLIAAGHQVCSDLGKGTPPDQVAADLTAYTSPWRSLGQQNATAIVAAARASYCP